MAYPGQPMKRLIFSLANLALASAASGALAQSAVTPTAEVPAEPVAVAPGSFTQRFEAARALARSGQREEALRAYDALLLASPGSADLLLARGQLHAWMKHWPEAEADLRAAAAESPGYTDVWSALGNTYLWSDRPEQAVNAFAKWIELKPDDAQARIARGRAYRAAGDTAAARADFEAAAALGADTAQVEGYLGSLTLRALNPDAVTAAGYLWSASLSGSHSTFSPSRADWSDVTLSVRRHFDRGSLALELLSANRFNSSDQAWALDGYVGLWQRAYANLRYQQGPSASLFPDNAWRAEVFQGVGKGWELSASYDYLGFGNGVDMYGLGLGKYVGKFYIRARRLYIPNDAGHSTSDRVQVRYYYLGDADNYLEVSSGWGRGEDRLIGGVVSDQRKHSASVSFVKFPSPRFGFKVGADLSGEKDGFDSRGVFGALYLRW